MNCVAAPAPAVLATAAVWVTALLTLGCPAGVEGWVAMRPRGVTIATRLASTAADASATGDAQAWTETVAFRIESAWQNALLGRPAELKAMLDGSCQWDSETGGSQRGAGAVLARLQTLGDKLEDPRFVVTRASRADGGSGVGGEADHWQFEWSFSANWLLPWRPRGRVGGTADVRVQLDAASGGLKIRSIADKLTAPSSLLSLGTEQLAPRFYDLLNIFATPHSEFPEWYTVEKCDGYIIREVAPQLVVKISTELDPELLQTQQASFLPNFAFTGRLKLRGKNVDDYVTTSPLTSFVETVPSELFPPTTRRVTFVVPVPSAFGLDPRALPPIPPLDARDPGELLGKAAPSAQVSYEYLPRRRVAVVPFGMEDPISVDGNEARKALLAALERDGRAVATSASSGKPVFSLNQNTAKLAWSRSGVFGMAIYTARPGYEVPNEITAELV